MSILETSHRIEGFRGINNVQDSNHLQVDAKTGLIFLKSADNVDISDNLRVSRRAGYEPVYTGGSNIHSMFAEEDICMFVSSTGLYSFDGTSATLITNTLTPNLRMNYTYIGGIVYYMNSMEKGYVYNNVSNSFVTPVDDFKKQLPSGHLIEYYNGRLYVAVDNLIFVSDPYILMQYDERLGIIPFEDRITVMKATNDGLWVGTKRNVVFLMGGSIVDFQYITKADFGAIENSAVVTTATNVGMEGDGKAVIFASKEGLCTATTGGFFKCVTNDYYRLYEDVQNSSAFLHVAENKHQYILLNEVYTVGVTGRIATDFPFVDSEWVDNPMGLPTLIASFTATFQ